MVLGVVSSSQMYREGEKERFTPTVEQLLGCYSSGEVPEVLRHPSCNGREERSEDQKSRLYHSMTEVHP